jgi:AcrR family transcriptional regulator
MLYICFVPRPKQYDRDEVLKQAMFLFWRKGFADTALHEIEEATGVNKSGLYSEFKDKEDIFLSSLMYYFRNRGNEKVLFEEPLGWDNIEKFLKVTTHGWAGQKGCFGVSSIRELNSLPAKARDIISESWIYLKQFFEKNISAEKTKMSPDILADILVTFFSGICIEQNLNRSKASRTRKIEEFIQAMRSM